MTIAEMPQRVDQQQPYTQFETIDSLHESGGYLLETGEHPFQYAPGGVIIDQYKEVDGGHIQIGSYKSGRASHRFGIYEPIGYDHCENQPTIVMTTALATGVKGHNQRVAEHMMHAGYRVIVKGPPRYPHIRTPALTLAQDANELLNMVKELEAQEIISKTEEIFLYGESQGAMKALGALSIAEHYNLRVTNALIVAPCYLRRINLKRPDKQIRRLIGMGRGVVKFVQQATVTELQQLRGTLNAKDMHHHVAVLPVLISGETGGFLDHIAPDQPFTVQLFGKDGHSNPHHSKKEFEDRFQNVAVGLHDGFGHLDGIMSAHTAALRNTMLVEVREARGQQVAA